VVLAAERLLQRTAGQVRDRVTDQAHVLSRHTTAAGHSDDQQTAGHPPNESLQHDNVIPAAVSMANTDSSGQQRCGIARLILLNGPPASGKTTLARRYVADHDGAALVEIDALQMTLPNWEQDEASRLAAVELAAAAIVEHLGAGRDVVMAQYFGRLGHVVMVEDLAREHGATFVEVILDLDATIAIERFRARRRAMAERGECHPERDIADADVETFIVDAVERLTRLPTVRSASRVVPLEVETSEDDVYRRLRAVLDE
jgi:predicted kinase